MIVIDHHQPINAVAPSSDGLQEKNEKTKTWTDVEVDPIEVDEFTDIPASKILIPDDNDEFIDPRLKDYPIPLIAKTVDLHNDDTEPILTFRFWVLSTFWIVVGCGVSSFYYFKPYYTSLTSYAIQLLAWGMGAAMAAYLPKRQFNSFGWKWGLNPGPWNAKEHALIVVAYWGSCYTAYGLGPLSAMELYYGKRMNAGWGIAFLICTQMIGYGLAGLFRDILVRPPMIYYPGVLPNVALFNAMHKNPSVTKIRSNSLDCSLPLLCYFGHGKWIAYVLGSGYYGFGLLDISLDWNFGTFFQPFYTPLWANAHQIVGAVATCWFIYPIMYLTNTLNAKNFAPMSSGTWDATGAAYNITSILTPQMTLNQTAMDLYSKPHWSPSYAMYFFWGFAASTGAMIYAILFYGPAAYRGLKYAFKSQREPINDPYLKLMEHLPRVPHWWYLALLGACTALGIGQLYGGDMQLPWWGFIIIVVTSTVFTFPNGILWGIANMQVGMAFLSEVIAGALFPGKPLAVLTCMVYGRQVLEQNLNLISDYKFGFYMKIPEKEMFIGQVWGTLIGPFVNYGMMRFIIDHEEPKLTGAIKSEAWAALKTKNFYSLSVLWGVLGPKVFFGKGSEYAWIYYGFLLGPILVVIVYILHRWKLTWHIEQRLNPVVFLYGCTLFPIYQTANLLTSAAASLWAMGYMLRYHPVWFRKYNYLLGVGLDCGTQLMQTVLVLGISLPNAVFPTWWGNFPDAVDRCFPPAELPPNALN